MIIRDLNLDAPYIHDDAMILSITQSKKCTVDEAERKYIDFWLTLRSDFIFQTRCTSSMFRRILGKTVRADCAKIVVECVKEIVHTKSFNAVGVRTIQVKYDIQKFFPLEPLEKKEKTLELLMEGVQKIAKLMQWDIMPFEQARDQVIHQNYQNYWLWKKVRNPSRDMYAELWIIHEIYSVDLVVVIRDNKGIEIIREIILSDKPDELIFDEYLGTFKWESNDKIVLTAKDPDVINGMITVVYRQWALNI